MRTLRFSKVSLVCLFASASIAACGESDDPNDRMDGLTPTSTVPTGSGAPTGSNPVTPPAMPPGSNTAVDPSPTVPSTSNTMTPPTPPVGPNPNPEPMVGPNPEPMVGPEPEPMAGPAPEPVAGPEPEPIVGPEPEPMAGPEPGPTANCTFEVNHQLSENIGTVGIVTWSTDLAGITEASIEFQLADGTGRAFSAPVDLAEPDYRTLLLGMKGDRDYNFHIVAKAGEQTCESEEFSLTTEPVPNMVTRVTRMPGEAADQAEPGFIITSGGIGAGGAYAFIFDQDGDVVWWANSPANCGRAHMDWEGKNMWMMSLNYPQGPNQGGDELRRVSMDGSGMESMTDMEGHHDFTVAPGGIVTVITWSGGCNAIVERHPDGTRNTIVENINTLYNATGPGGNSGGQVECHGNAIGYQPEPGNPAGGTYVLSDRNPSLYVRFDRQGQLMWQLGGGNPLGTHFTAEPSWNVNHGLHLLENGNFLLFNNDIGQMSTAREYTLPDGQGQATQVWSHSSGGSATLGDVQRLPNGNTLITYSNSGTIQEVTTEAPARLVQTFETNSVGYVLHRPTLYGPPPK